MARRRARLTSLSVAAICGWALCAASLVAQAPATTPLPNAPEGFDVRKSDIKAGRVERVEYRLEGDRQQASGDGVSAARLLVRQEVSRALSAARDWRQRESLDAVRQGRQHSRQPDRRQQSHADDRGDAERPRIERTVDGVRRTRRPRWRRTRTGSARRAAAGRTGTACRTAGRRRTAGRGSGRGHTGSGCGWPRRQSRRRRNERRVHRLRRVREGTDWRSRFLSSSRAIRCRPIASIVRWRDCRWAADSR